MTQPLPAHTHTHTHTHTHYGVLILRLFPQYPKAHTTPQVEMARKNLPIFPNGTHSYTKILLHCSFTNILSHTACTSYSMVILPISHCTQRHAHIAWRCDITIIESTCHGMHKNTTVCISSQPHGFFEIAHGVYVFAHTHTHALHGDI